MKYEHSLVFCFRFVASCGFTPDVKVWEVCFGKSGEFKEVTRAFDLKGHSAGVHSFSFSNDSRRYGCDIVVLRKYLAQVKLGL